MTDINHFISRRHSASMLIDHIWFKSFHLEASFGLYGCRSYLSQIIATIQPLIHGNVREAPEGSKFLDTVHLREEPKGDTFL